MYEKFLQFSKGFVWGSATASYQIEGGDDIDGKGESIWDVFAHEKGHIADGRTGDVACDSYHRYAEDVALMRYMHLGAYRMSLAWSRLFPDGTKQSLNQKGVDYYDRVIDCLLENGIEPYVTLFHWDLPEALQCKGGFASREIVAHFLDYADFVSSHFKGRVKNYMTFNEPWVYSYCGHLYGVHAPGLKDLRTTLSVSHNILLSHAMALPVMKENDAECKVGIVNNLAHVVPASERQEDRDAARRWDLAFNKWYLDPLFKGGYPEEMVSWYGPLMMKGYEKDMDTIAQGKGDFLGVNYYTRRLVAYDGENAHIKARQVYRTILKRAEFEEWEIAPESLYHVLTGLLRDYGSFPLFVSENGTTGKDECVGADGCVHDSYRIDFLRRHFGAAYQAMQEGVDLRGYFVWSLLDNFEWGFGFTKRFGLVYTDFDHQERRTMKDSASFMKAVATDNGFLID